MLSAHGRSERRSQVAWGVSKPFLSVRLITSSGNFPRRAFRRTTFVVVPRNFWASGIANRNSTRRWSRKGRRVSRENAIELRSAKRSSFGSIEQRICWYSSLLSALVNLAGATVGGAKAVVEKSGNRQVRFPSSDATREPTTGSWGISAPATAWKPLSFD